MPSIGEAQKAEKYYQRVTALYRYAAETPARNRPIGWNAYAIGSKDKYALFPDYPSDVVIMLAELKTDPGVVEVKAYPHTSEIVRNAAVEAVLNGVTLSNDISSSPDELYELMTDAIEHILRDQEPILLAMFDYAHASYAVVDAEKFVSLTTHIGARPMMDAFDLRAEARKRWSAKLAEHPVRARASFGVFDVDAPTITCEGYVRGQYDCGRFALALSEVDILTKFAPFVAENLDVDVTIDPDANQCVVTDNGGERDCYMLVEIDGERYCEVMFDWDGWSAPVEVEHELERS